MEDLQEAFNQIPKEQLAHAAAVCRDLGNEAVKAGKHEDAVAGYSAALSLPLRAREKEADMERKLALCWRARARLALNMTEGAADDCLNVLGVDAEFGPALLVLGQVFTAEEKFEEARAVLLRAATVLGRAPRDDLLSECEAQLVVVQSSLPRVAAGQPQLCAC